jgi:hypothetical protein
MEGHRRRTGPVVEQRRFGDVIFGKIQLYKEISIPHFDITIISEIQFQIEILFIPLRSTSVNLQYHSRFNIV